MMQVAARIGMVVLGVCLVQNSAATHAQTVWYVDSQGAAVGRCASWNDACADLQAALNLASFGDEIWVAAGNYTPDSGNGDPAATFRLVSGVAVYGGFVGTETSLEERSGLFDQTVLSGDLGTTGVYHVVTAERTDNGTVLDGFTITGGKGDGPCCADDRGGAVVISSSTLAIRNCALIDNSAKNIGAAVAMRWSDITISDCLIENNLVAPGSVGAAIHDGFASDLTVINTVFRNNGFTPHNVGGGAIFVSGHFLSNSASSLNATDCVFVGNRATAGGAILNMGFAWLTNAVFIDNLAEGIGLAHYKGNGGAIANFGELTVTNCSFFNNTAVIAGAGLYNGFQTGSTSLDSMTIVANSVLWGNGAPVDTEFAQIFSADDDLLVDFSCVEGLTGNLGGAHNIGENPLFVDSDAGNLRLSGGSPCIDAGDNDSVPEDVSTDLDGLPRYQDDPATRNTGRPRGVRVTVDMGAYEFAGSSCPDDDGDGLVTICHIPPGIPAKPRTRTVPEYAVRAHLAHGDGCGACQATDFSSLLYGPARTSLPASKRRGGFDRDANQLGGRFVSFRHRGLSPNCAIDADQDGVVDEDEQ